MARFSKLWHTCSGEETSVRIFRDNCFLINLVFDRKNLEITKKKIFGRAVKTTLYVSRETLTEQHFQKKCWKNYVFRFNNEVFGTVAKNFFRFAKTPINVQRIKLRKTLSYKTKLAVLWKFWVKFFYFQRKSSPELSNCNLQSLGTFWGKTLFETLHNVPNFFRFSAKETTFRGKDFFRDCHNCHPRVQSEISMRKKISRNCIFPFIFEVWAISLSFSENFGQLCQNSILRAQRKKFGERIFRKKCFL